MDLRNIASFQNYSQKCLKNVLKSSPNMEVFTHAKIRGGLGEILAVRYGVRPRP